MFAKNNLQPEETVAGYVLSHACKLDRLRRYNQRLTEQHVRSFLTLSCSCLPPHILYANRDTAASINMQPHALFTAFYGRSQMCAYMHLPPSD
eukprot:48953-Eustigmatos_ZCMA.PRE.1